MKWESVFEINPSLHVKGFYNSTQAPQFPLCSAGSWSTSRWNK